MIFAASLYLAAGFSFLIGMKRDVKLKVGGVFTGLFLLFLSGVFLIRYKTGYYGLSEQEWLNKSGVTALGDWVLPFYFIGSFLLLFLIDYRFFYVAFTSKGVSKWGLLCLTSLFNVLYLIGFAICLALVTVSLYPIWQ